MSSKHSEYSSSSSLCSLEKICRFGCPTFGYSAEQLEKHKKDHFHYHLDMLYSILTHYGYDRSSLDMQSEIEEAILQDIQMDLAEAENLIKEGNYLRKKLAIKVEERKKQMRILEKVVAEVSLTSFNGNLTWIIADSLHHDIIVLSPIFYTGKYGYKLQLKLYKKTHGTELYLMILKGNYDAILSETFATEVKVQYKTLLGCFEPENSVKISLSRVRKEDKADEKEHFITNLPSIQLEVVKLKVDCSDFEISSID